MNNLAIVGAGGLGREVFLIVKRINDRKKCWNFIGFFDDNPDIKWRGSEIELTYLGNIADLNTYPEVLHVIVAVGNPLAVFEIVNRIINNNISFPNIVSVDSIVYDGNTFTGVGNIIASGCVFTNNVKVGSHNLFNYNSCFGHDVAIGNFNVFNPGTIISGNVTIGDKNFFGLNSAVIQGKTIGSRNKIGAATLMLKNVKDDESFFGIPGKKLDPRF